MSNEEKEGVRRMVVETIWRLRKSDTEPAHVGSRYARLISLLWRRPPRRPPTASARASTATAAGTASTEGSTNGHALAPSGGGFGVAHGLSAGGGDEDGGNLNQTATDSLEVTQGDFSLNTFSWLDLDAVNHFATVNSGHMGAADISPSFADMPPGVNDGQQHGMAFGTHAIDSQTWFSSDPQHLVF